jgi:hypothetical protein
LHFFFQRLLSLSHLQLSSSLRRLRFIKIFLNPFLEAYKNQTSKYYTHTLTHTRARAHTIITLQKTHAYTQLTQAQTQPGTDTTDTDAQDTLQTVLTVMPVSTQIEGSGRWSVS